MSVKMTRPVRAVRLVTAFLFLALLAGGGLSLFLVRTRLSPPASLSPPVGRLALTGPDGNIYAARPDGTELYAITNDASGDQEGGMILGYQWPTWSPDGKEIAFISDHILAQGKEWGLHVAQADGSGGSVIFHSRESMPIFSSWSPDSHYLSFLTQEERDLALRLVDPERGTRSQRLLERGSPFYFSWAPDSSGMVMHVGGSWLDSPFASISKTDLESEEKVSFSKLPASFSVPAWSPDGKHLLYAVRHSGDTMALVLADLAGEEETEVTLFRGAISFLWSPIGDQLAYVLTHDPDLGTFGPVQVWEMTGDALRLLTQENALAFFWSPDGKKIAYLVPELGPRQDNQRLVRTAIYLADVESGETKWLASFLPSDPLQNVLANFAQYSQAISFWSPDSRHFVYSGEGDVGGIGIWVVDVETGLRSQVAAGTLAVWSRQ